MLTYNLQCSVITTASCRDDGCVCEGFGEQYDDAKYDIHEDVTEVWAVG